jgi:hypothetical protein
MKRSAGDGVQVVNAFVPPRAEVEGMRWAAVLGQGGGCGAGEDPGLKEPPGDECRGLRLAETHSGVETVGHEFVETVTSHDLHRQLRVGCKKFSEARCEHETREEAIVLNRTSMRSS